MSGSKSIIVSISLVLTNDDTEDLCLNSRYFEHDVHQIRRGENSRMSFWNLEGETGVSTSPNMACIIDSSSNADVVSYCGPGKCLSMRKCFFNGTICESPTHTSRRMERIVSLMPTCYRNHAGRTCFKTRECVGDPHLILPILLKLFLYR